MGDFAILLGLTLFMVCDARPQGMPPGACSTLTPVHSNIQPQRSAAPFSLSVSRVANKVRVRIFSSVGEEFEGFALQARSSKNRQQMIDGRFSERREVTRTVDCLPGKENTLTQVSPTPKREIVTEWTPSVAIDEDIIFRATVAKTFALFWTEVDSNPIRIRSDSSAAGRSERKEDSDHMYDNCFVSKGCFGIPSGCINRRDCEVLLSYTKAVDGISFTMNGALEPNAYMAMGLSMDSTMGDDHVTECVRRESNIAVRNSWNDGKSNTRTREMARDGYSSAFTNGIASCSFTADYFTQANSKQFNLANNTYYMLLAKGPMRNDRLSYHSLRIATQEPVNLTAFDMIDAESVSDAIKVHGAFMVSAWIGLVSLSILLARHFKSSWESKTLCGVKIWFALHRGLNVLALSFIVIAFIVIFVYKDGWNYETSNPHAVLGCIATALGLFQAIMAIFRPAPDHSNRIIFNYLHWAVGNGAQIIAVITIFFAVSLESSGLNESFYWVVSIFVVLHLIFHLAFQVHSWTAGKKQKNEMKMLELAGRGTNNTSSNTQEKGLFDGVFRSFLLSTYCLFITVILFAFYILIGVA